MGMSSKPIPSKQKLQQYRNATLRAVQSNKRYQTIAKKLACEKGILKVLECLKSEAERKVQANEKALEKQSKTVVVLNAKKNVLFKKVHGTLPRRTNEPDLNNVKSRRVPGLAPSLRRTIEAMTSPFALHRSPNAVQRTNALSSMIMCTHRQGQNRSCVLAGMLNLVSMVLGLRGWRVPISPLAEALTAEVGSDAHGFTVPDVIAHLNQVVQGSVKVYATDKDNTFFLLKFKVNLIDTITGKDAITAFARSDRARKGLFLIRTDTSKLGHCFAAQGKKCWSHFDVIPSSLKDPEVMPVNKTSDVWSLEIQNIELTPITGGPSIHVPSYPAPVLRYGAK